MIVWLCVLGQQMTCFIFLLLENICVTRKVRLPSYTPKATKHNISCIWSTTLAVDLTLAKTKRWAKMKKTKPKQNKTDG